VNGIVPRARPLLPVAGAGALVNRLWILSLAVLSAALVACSGQDGGGKKSQGTPKINVPPGDPRLPDLTRAAPLLLASYTDFSLIEGIFPGLRVVAPVVGDPKLRLTIQGSGPMASGTVLFFMEDAEGAFWMTQPLYPRTFVRNGNVVDAIFQDDDVVTRITATESASRLSGTYSVRIRPNASETVCKLQRPSCQVQGNPPPWDVPPADNPCSPNFDPNAFLDRLANECRQAMDASAPLVRTLGEFQQVFADQWLQ
jgi:hypothetical protein